MPRLTGPHHRQRAEELLMLSGPADVGVLLKALTHAVLALTSATAANIRKNGATGMSEEWMDE